MSPCETKRPCSRHEQGDRNGPRRRPEARAIVQPVSASTLLRRQSWYGLKKPVKRMLAARGTHFAMRRVVRFTPSIAVHRLPAPQHLGSVVADMDGVSFTMLRPDQCVVAKELYWGRGRRPGLADQRALDTFAVLSDEASCVLDVGCYTGIFSLLAAHRSHCDVHAFDIVPAVADAARANVITNDLEQRIRVHLLGLDAEAGSTFVAAGHSGSALPDFYSTDLHFADGVEVPLMTLDAWASGQNLPPGRTLIKIDVEGTEHRVLAGGTSFLGERRPDLVCEILPKARTEQITEILAPLGYAFLAIRPDCLEERGVLAPDPGVRDWLFTARGSANLRELGLGVQPGTG